MAKGRTVRMFLADGTAEGLRIVEMSNWTGVGLVCARADWGHASRREELAKPGVYVLAGERDGEPVVYVGQAEVLRTRIGQHDAQRDFWEQVVVFTSKDANLTTSHARWLESRLIARAQRARRARIENGNAPAAPALPEAEQSDMETFLENMLLLYPLVGVSAFDLVAITPPPTPAPVVPTGRGATTPAALPPEPDPAPEPARADDFPPLFINTRGARGEGRYLPEGFLVLAGSIARREPAPSCPEALRRERQRLIDAGVLKAHGDAWIVSADVLFGSPSTAAGVLLAASANGRIEWKTADGRTLKQLQEARAGEPTP